MNMRKWLFSDLKYQVIEVQPDSFEQEDVGEHITLQRNGDKWMWMIFAPGCSEPTYPNSNYGPPDGFNKEEALQDLAQYLRRNLERVEAELEKIQEAEIQKHNLRIQGRTA